MASQASRKELADAGRRKLEEFRKAKLQPKGADADKSPAKIAAAAAAAAAPASSPHVPSPLAPAAAAPGAPNAGVDGSHEAMSLGLAGDRQVGDAYSSPTRSYQQVPALSLLQPGSLAAVVSAAPPAVPQQQPSIPTSPELPALTLHTVEHHAGSGAPGTTLSTAARPSTATANGSMTSGSAHASLAATPSDRSANLPPSAPVTEVAAPPGVAQWHPPATAGSNAPLYPWSKGYVPASQSVLAVALSASSTPGGATATATRATDTTASGRPPSTVLHPTPAAAAAASATATSSTLAPPASSSSSLGQDQAGIADSGSWLGNKANSRDHSVAAATSSSGTAHAASGGHGYNYSSSASQPPSGGLWSSQLKPTGNGAVGGTGAATSAPWSAPQASANPFLAPLPPQRAPPSGAPWLPPAPAPVTATPWLPPAPAVGGAPAAAVADVPPANASQALASAVLPTPPPVSPASVSSRFPATAPEETSASESQPVVPSPSLPPVMNGYAALSDRYWSNPVSNGPLAPAGTSAGQTIGTGNTAKHGDAGLQASANGAISAPAASFTPSGTEALQVPASGITSEPGHSHSPLRSDTSASLLRDVDAAISAAASVQAMQLRHNVADVPAEATASGLKSLAPSLPTTVPEASSGGLAAPPATSVPETSGAAVPPAAPRSTSPWSYADLSDSYLTNGVGRANSSSSSSGAAACALGTAAAESHRSPAGVKTGDDADAFSSPDRPPNATASRHQGAGTTPVATGSASEPPSPAQLNPAQLQQPSAAAGTVSRFSWLFGSPARPKTPSGQAPADAAQVMDLSAAGPGDGAPRLANGGTSRLGSTTLAAPGSAIGAGRTDGAGLPPIDVGHQATPPADDHRGDVTASGTGAPSTNVAGASTTPYTTSAATSLQHTHDGAPGGAPPPAAAAAAASAPSQAAESAQDKSSPAAAGPATSPAVSPSSSSAASTSGEVFGAREASLSSWNEKLGGAAAGSAAAGATRSGGTAPGTRAELYGDSSRPAGGASAGRTGTAYSAANTEPAAVATPALPSPPPDNLSRPSPSQSTKPGLLPSDSYSPGGNDAMDDGGAHRSPVLSGGLAANNCVLKRLPASAATSSSNLPDLAFPAASSSSFTAASLINRPTNVLAGRSASPAASWAVAPQPPSSIGSGNAASHKASSLATATALDGVPPPASYNHLNGFNTSDSGRVAASRQVPAPPLSTQRPAPSFLDAYLENLLKPASAGKSLAAGDASVTGEASRRESDSGSATKTAAAAGQSSNGDVATAAGGSTVNGTASPPEEDGDAGVTAPMANGHDSAAVHLAGGAAGHSRRTSMDSTASHGGWDASGKPPRMASAPTQAQFAGLRRHIDELTEEKMELMRGLAQQGRIQEALVEENEQLAAQYNANGKLVDELQQKLRRYEAELEAQSLALDGLAADRDAARSGALEASARSAALAAEVVALEQELLSVKSDGLKAQRDAEGARDRLGKVERQLAAVRAEQTALNEQLTTVTQEKRALAVRVQQAEHRLGAIADGASSSSARDSRAATAPSALPVPPPAVQVAEQGVQCDLAPAAAATAAAVMAGPTAVPAAPEPCATATAVQSVPPGAWSEGRGVTQQSPGAAAGSPAVTARGPGGVRPSSSEQQHVPGEAGTWNAVALMSIHSEEQDASGDAPSTILAQRALERAATLGRGFSSGGGAALAGGSAAHVSGSTSALAALSKWLPRGDVSGCSPVAAMAEEEVRLVGHIHTLLADVEGALAAWQREALGLRASNDELKRERDHLRVKLEMQTQRYELALQGSMHQSPGSMYSQPISEDLAYYGGLPTSTLALPPLSGPSLLGTPQSHLSTPVAGGTYHPSRLAGEVHTEGRDTPAGGNHSSGMAQQQQLYLQQAPQMHGQHVAGHQPQQGRQLGEGGEGQEGERRRGWLGFLIGRPRPKKRSRSALI